MELGSLVTVELTESVAARYNSANGAVDDVKAGTPRPALVVDVHPATTVEDAQGNKHDVPETVNLAIFHNGDFAPYYVQNVPADALTLVGGKSATSQPTQNVQEASAPETGAGAPRTETGWNPNREGTGEPYTGPGPSAPNLTAPTQNDPPAPGTTVPGQNQW